MNLDVGQKNEEEEISEIQEKPVGAEKGLKKSWTEGKTILIISLIIIGILVVSLGGFFKFNQTTGATIVMTVHELHKLNLEGKLSPERGYLYHGRSFVKSENLWWTVVNVAGTTTKIPLHFGPKEVEMIPITGQLNQGFNAGEQQYVAINPEVQDKYYTLALSELSFNIVKGLNRSISGTCPKENNICDNRTIVSCNNSQGLPVIELALANETGIELLGNCLKISGQEYDLVKAVDRLLSQWYGVMK